MKITLVEALPSVLPMFSKQLIAYTEDTFKEAKIEILTKTMVKEIKDKSVVLQMPDKTIAEVPCGMVVWAAVSFHCSHFESFSDFSTGKHFAPLDQEPDEPIRIGPNQPSRTERRRSPPNGRV